MRKTLKNIFIPHADNDFQPSVLKPRTLFVLAVVLLIIKILIFFWFFGFPKSNQFAVVTGSRLIELTNKERVAAGLNSLNVNQKLVQAAQEKAQDMLNKNYFDHTSPSGLTPWFWLDKTGYKYKAAGENLAKDFTDSQALHQAWMDSSSHRSNILNKNYQETGIAVIEGQIDGKKTILAVQFFGKSPLSVAPVTKPLAETEKTPPIVSNMEIEIETKEPILQLEPEKEAIKGGKISSLKGPDVFREQENLKTVSGISIEILNIVSIIGEKSENFIKRFYFIILASLGIVLLLTIFINIRVQYPKIIFTALALILIIAGLALFNIQEFLNRGIDII